MRCFVLEITMSTAVYKEQTVDSEIRVGFVYVVIINRYERVNSAGNTCPDKCTPPDGFFTVSKPFTVNLIGEVWSENLSKMFIR